MDNQDFDLGSLLEEKIRKGESEDLIEQLKNRGFSQIEILDIYFQYFLKLQDENRGEEVYYIEDELDRIVGRCDRKFMYFEDYLTNQDISDYHQKGGKKIE
jgi:hypothetical protein